MVDIMDDAKAKLAQLAEVVGQLKSCLILSHTNPDPDAIASSVLLKRLFEKQFGIKVTLSFHGVIGRAENQELVQYTREEFTRFTKAALGRVDFLALVDTQPAAGNNPVSPEDEPLVVFDHHKIKPHTRRSPFFLVRSETGATVTLIYQLFAAAGLEPDARLATVISYALQSETADLQKEASALDVALFNEIAPLSDRAALNAIRYPKVSTDYFVSIHRAIEEAVLYGDVIILPLGELSYPDVVAEVADYFLRYRPVRYSVALGIFRGELLISARSLDKEPNLGTLSQRVVRDIGSAGGHGMMAGGQIPLTSDTPQAINRMKNKVINRFLKELKANKRKPVQLLDRMYREGT